MNAHCQCNESRVTYEVGKPNAENRNVPGQGWHFESDSQVPNLGGSSMSTIELVPCISNCGRKRSTEADGFEVAGIDENGRVVWWCRLCAKKQAQSHGDLNKARLLWKEDKIKVASVSSNLVPRRMTCNK